MRRALLLATLLGSALLAPSVARAAMAPSDLLATMKRVKASDYPSANSVVLVDDQSVVYQPDGQFQNTIHTVRMVLTEAGKNSAAHAAVDYAKDAETVDQLVAQVVKADGTLVPVPATDIQDTELSGEMNSYDPNGRSVKITFPDFAVGDAVELSYRLTRRTPTRTGFFNDIFEFQGESPILEASYAVDGPATLPLTSHVYHPERSSKIEITAEKAGDRVHYRWAAKDEAQLVPEALMDASIELPALIVSTDPSWQDFSKWWAGVTAPQLEVTDAMKKKVAELTKSATTDDEKIKALYDFVSSDVRYRGLGVGPRTGYTPRPAAETYQSRWGVCRDVAILLVALLRADGFEAYPVLTNVGDPVLPAFAYDGFNHAIVAMPKKGGGWTYLDPTAKNNNQLLPGNEAEQSALVCTPKGEPLGLTPAAPPADNFGHAVAESAIGADGALTSHVRLQTKGILDLVLRSMAAMMPPAEQHDTAEMLLHQALPDATLVSFSLSNPLELSSPMTIDAQIVLPRAAIAAGNYRLLRTLVTSGALGIVEELAPRLLGALPARKYTLDAHVTFQYDEDETVTLPAGTKVLALPNDARATNAVSELTAKCQAKDATTVVCHRSFVLKSRFIDPTQYTALRSVFASLGQIAHQPVILGASTSIARSR